jgi:hypothetical protein
VGDVQDRPTVVAVVPVTTGGAKMPYGGGGGHDVVVEVVDVVEVVVDVGDVVVVVPSQICAMQVTVGGVKDAALVPWTPNCAVALTPRRSFHPMP